MEIGKLILLSLFALLAQSVILAMEKVGAKKCLYTELSPDKTLEARLGLVRKEPNPCNLFFKINIINQQRQHLETILSLQKQCQSTTPARGIQPTIFKHSLSNQNTTGLYEICTEVLQNDNQEILIEMFIGQRLNPTLYENTGTNMPLVAASQLTNLNFNIDSIAKSLAKTSIMAKVNREKGQETEMKLKQVEQAQVVLKQDKQQYSYFLASYG